MTRPCFTVPCDPTTPGTRGAALRRLAPRAAALFLAASLIAPAWTQAAAREAGRSGPDISAPIGLLMEVSSGKVLFEKNADEPHPPASITKIMTMLLIMDAVDSHQISLDDEVTVSAHASKIGGSQVYLAEGEQMTVRDLLKAIAIHSANDACVAMAEFISGDVQDFVDRMNDRARELGMKHTEFHTPHGLPPDPGQQEDMTTARDVAIMSIALIQKHPKILEFTGIAHDTLRGGKFRLDNTNRLVGRVAGVDGLKTGFTNDAGFGLASTAKRKDLRMLSVVMGARTNRDRARDSARLLSYGFSRLRRYLAVEKGQDIEAIPVPRGRTEQVMAQAGSDLHILVSRGEESNLSFEVKPLEGLRAPVQAGQEIGSYVALLDGKVVGKIPLVAKAPVEKANLIILFFRWLLALLHLS